MKKAVTFVITIMLLGIAGLLLWLGHGSPQSSSAPSAYGTPAPLLTPTIQPAINPTSAEEPVNGFEVSGSSHLQITARTRQVFDYFLGSGNDAPSGANTARTQRFIHAHLQEPAATEAAALLDHYVAYRKAASSWQAGNATTVAPGNADLAAIATLQQSATLKAQYLSPEVIQAFYGDEDAIAHYQLARKQIQQMNGMSQEQKNEQLATLRQQLPLSVQKALKNARDEDE